MSPTYRVHALRYAHFADRPSAANFLLGDDHAGAMALDMCLHAGTAEIAPGITVHLIGGHTGGLQIMRVPTARGWVVLASDAVHFWANIRTRNPFPYLHNVERVLDGLATCEALAEGPDHIIPGHDPEVLRRFPPVAGQDGTVRVDLPPTA